MGAAYGSTRRIDKELISWLALQETARRVDLVHAFETRLPIAEVEDLARF